MHSNGSSQPKRIGIFDSGSGGLSVAHALQDVPSELLVYLADTTYLPYGERSGSWITDRSVALTRYLIETWNVDTVIVACHTASSWAFKRLCTEFPGVTIVEMVQPTISHTLQQTKNKIICLLSTSATIQSGVYQNNVPSDHTLITQACPQLVPLLENNSSTHTLQKVLRAYLKKGLTAGADTVLIGCTHYTFLEQEIRTIAPHLMLASPLLPLQHYWAPSTTAHNPKLIGITTGSSSVLNTIASSLSLRFSRITQQNIRPKSRFHSAHVELNDYEEAL